MLKAYKIDPPRQWNWQRRFTFALAVAILAWTLFSLLYQLIATDGPNSSESLSIGAGALTFVAFLRLFLWALPAQPSTDDGFVERGIVAAALVLGLFWGVTEWGVSRAAQSAREAAAARAPVRTEAGEDRWWEADPVVQPEGLSAREIPPSGIGMPKKPGYFDDILGPESVESTPSQPPQRRP